MGKKTDEFIATIDTLMNECRRYVGDYVKVADQLVEIDVKQYPVGEELSARLKELVAEHGRAEGAKISQTDPTVVRCQKQLTAFNKMVDVADKQRRAVKDELFNRIARIEGRVAAFEAHVNKKAKSKNPFKSKKSIPSARVYIDACRQFHASMEKYLSSIGGVEAF